MLGSLGARTRWCDLSSDGPKSRSRQSIRQNTTMCRTKCQSGEALMESWALLSRVRLASLGDGV